MPCWLIVVTHSVMQGAPGTRQAAGRSSSSSERGKYQGMPPLPCSTVPGLQQQDAGASSGKGVLDMLQQQRLHRMEGAPSVSTGLQVTWGCCSAVRCEGWFACCGRPWAKLGLLHSS
jgi:hypothetical protein